MAKSRGEITVPAVAAVPITPMLARGDAGLLVARRQGLRVRTIFYPNGGVS